MMRFNLKNKDNINAPNTSSSLILLVAAPVMCAAAGGMGWGGLLCALIVLVGYVGYIKKDRLARNMVFVGIMSRGLGFTMGQWIKSKNSWTPDWLTTFDLSLRQWLLGIFPEKFFSLMGWNWWNMMETIFGLFLGFGLGLGL